MGRTQLNINIDPRLMLLLKQNAIKSGKTISEFVVDAITHEVNNAVIDRSIEDRLSSVEQRISSLEDLSSIASGKKKITLFTDFEAKNCNEFIKGVFQEEVKRKKYKSDKDAWNDFIGYIDCFEQWNDIYTLRLKEALFIKDGDLLTSSEMNSFTHGKTCPCPIRSGLINWINNAKKGECSCANENFPSQQTICDKGSKLLEELYGS